MRNPGAGEGWDGSEVKSLFPLETRVDGLEHEWGVLSCFPESLEGRKGSVNTQIYKRK